MKKLIEQRYLIRQNLLTIIGFILFSYFSYHAVLGERSYVRLLTLERQVSEITQTHNALETERLAWEKKVTMLRPGSIDKDLLEERARYVLGYGYEDERIILAN
jgi:cell division protein FtsB